MLLLLASYAAAGTYGVPVDGFPSADERAVVLWTNAARVAPEAFTDDYSAGGCSTDVFSDDELTPKDPLYIDLDLTEVARVHSEDMVDNGCFQHESCDGTDTWTRIAQYYTDASTALGENIAYGYGGARTTVLSGWMCSDSGHRENIMSGDFNEMGAGVDGDTMTQDFAGGELNDGTPPVRVAILEDGTFYADWGDSAAPASLDVVRDGLATPMALEWGADDNGVYAASDVDEDAATSTHTWFVSWTTASGSSGIFPEVGSFDDDGGYSAEQVDVTGGEDDGGVSLKLVGCATVPAREGLGALAIGALAILASRRNRTVSPGS